MSTSQPKPWPFSQCEYTLSDRSLKELTHLLVYWKSPAPPEQFVELLAHHRIADEARCELQILWAARVRQRNL